MSRRHAALLALATLCAAGCARAASYMYTVKPLPVVVNPPSADWDVEISVDFSDVMKVTFVNRGAESVNVLWDDCAYIDIDSRSHRIVTASARGGISGAAQATAPVAPGTRVEETITPVPIEGQASRDPFLPQPDTLLVHPGYVGRSLAGLRAGQAEKLVGRHIGLFLVFERNGEKKTVLAKYEISRVNADF
jgi:hypothetical protein